MSEHIAAKSIDAGGKLTVKSALNPIFWLCAIVSVPGLIAIQFIEPIPNMANRFGMWAGGYSNDGGCNIAIHR